MSNEYLVSDLVEIGRANEQILVVKDPPFIEEGGLGQDALEDE